MKDFIQYGFVPNAYLFDVFYYVHFHPVIFILLHVKEVQNFLVISPMLRRLIQVEGTDSKILLMFVVFIKTLISGYIFTFHPDNTCNGKSTLILPLEYRNRGNIFNLYPSSLLPSSIRPKVCYALQP